MRRLQELKFRLNEMHEAHVGVKEVFMRRTETSRAMFLERIAAFRDQLLDCCLSRASSEALSNAGVQVTFNILKQYARASDWNLVDVAVLALCLENVNEEDLAQQIASTCLAFHSLRMIDDVIDCHLSYKGNYPTMYGDLSDRIDLKPVAADVTLIAALLLLSQGVVLSPTIVTDLQKTIVGALHERLVNDPSAEYDSIVARKMISYGMVLYAPVLSAIEEKTQASMSSFLEASFRLGQLLNDLLDAEADLHTKQPNFWNIHRDDGAEMLLEELGRLAAKAEALPEQFRPYGKTRVVDLTCYGIQIVDSLAASSQARSFAT